MAAAASEIPDDLLPMIRAASTATTDIRDLIEKRKKNSDEIITINEPEINSITVNLGRPVSELYRPIGSLKSIIQKRRTLRNGDPRKDICNKASDILSLYPDVDLILQQLGIETHQEDNTAAVNKSHVNYAYTELLRPLREMETRWNTLITEIEATRAGQAVNHRGGYRKRKQRTQRKQRKQRKQKHCKTLKRK